MIIKLEKKYIYLFDVFASGIIIGATAARLLLQKKLNEEVAFQIETVENTYYAAIALREASDRVREDIKTELDNAVLHGDGLVKVEDGHIVPLSEIPLADLDEVPDYLHDVANVTPLEDEPVKNQYHRALNATETPVEKFVDGGINDYGISYIEEEDYIDEDGFEKLKLDILFKDNETIFLMDGEAIDDWDRRVGDSILVDMFNLCPPGIDAVLYVRNHRTNEDYEVVRDEP